MSTANTATAASYPLLKKGTPQSMDELLGDGYQLQVPQRGSTVVGTITSIGPKSLSVDINAKTEGVVSDKEFQMASEYIAGLKVGESIEAQVISAETTHGRISLSLRKLAQEAKWEYFQHALESGETLEAKGIDVNRGGLIVMVNGTRGFVPSSQFGKEMVGNFHQLKGQTVQVKAIEVDAEKNRLIFSERHVSEADEIAKKNAALESVEEGKVYEGTVSGVMHFGLFVTVEIPVGEGIGHVEGLVHISEISWEKVSHPKDYHKVGERISVRVLGVDDKTNKLNLSIKQLKEDPWKTIEERYEVGMTLTGTISRVEAFGVFVNVEEGVDGLIHSSKLEPGQAMTKGDEIVVHVESVDSKQRRMSLSPIKTEMSVEYR